MKEYKLGTFFGQEIVLKSNEESDWVKKWENYIESIKINAIEKYKDDLTIKEMENKIKITKNSFWYKLGMKLFYKSKWR